MSTATSLKLTLPRKPLADRFGTAANVTPARTPKPVLQNVLLTVTEGQVILSATDLELSVTLPLTGVRCDGDGSVLLPAAKVGKILATVPDDEITIEADGEKLLIQGGRSRFSLPCESVESYPHIEPRAEGEWVTLRGDLLRQMIRRTIYATDTDSPRYALGGVYVGGKDGTMRFVATDGRRLAMASTPADVPFESSPVIPLKTLKLIDRVIGDTARLAWDGKSAWVETDGIEIQTRLVEGRFPAYESIFPANRTAIASTTAAELLAAIEQAAITTSEESRGVDLAFAPGELALRSSAADVGESTVRLPLAYEGEPLTLTFDHRYMSDALKALDGGTLLNLELFGPKSPLIVKAEGFTYVVMPLTRD
jgi:DNA polymerase-3 subunit beta